MKDNVKLSGLLLIIVIMYVCIAGCTDASSKSPDITSGSVSSHSSDVYSSGLLGIPNTCKYDKISTTTGVNINETLELTGRFLTCTDENVNYIEIKVKPRDILYWVQESALQKELVV